MRKTIAIILIAFAAAGIFPAFAFAAPSHQAKFVIGRASYEADGASKQMDAAAFVKNGRTYVPVRYLALALGVAENDIGWDGKTRTVTLKLDNVTLRLTIGSKTLYVNGQPRQMDVAPVIVKGRTYLPARWVAEAFGYEVHWDAGTKTVLVFPPGRVVKPEPVVGYKIDWNAAKSGTLQPPPGAVAPPDVWGFPAKAVRMEFKVGSRYAKVWAYTPEMAELDRKIKTKEDELRRKYNNWFWSDANPDKSGGLGLDDDIPNGKRFQKWYQSNRDPEYDNLLVQRQKLTDESTYTLDLGAPCVFVIAKDTYPVVGTAEGYKAWLIQNYGKTVGYNSENVVVALEGKKNTALYVPFIPVAEAFGVPRENIVWDGQHLAVFGWDAVDGYRDGYLAFKAGSKESPAKWHTGEVTVGHLEFPLFVKDGVPMMGINSVCDFLVLFRAPGDYCAILNIWQGNEGGWDYETGIAVISGEL